MFIFHLRFLPFSIIAFVGVAAIVDLLPQEKTFMPQRTDRLIPEAITIKHELPPEVRAILHDLHSDRQAFGIGAALALLLAALAVIRYLFESRK